MGVPLIDTDAWEVDRYSEVIISGYLGLKMSGFNKADV